MPQSQLEPHQPLKSSASTHIKRLFIRLPYTYGRWDRNERATGGLQKRIDAGGELLPVATNNLAWVETEK